MDNISFTSLIRPVTQNIFGDAVAKIGQKNSVNYPWTVKESVKAPAAYTRGVCDCSMLGITDGQDILMLHLCPTNSANKNYFEINRYIAQHMNLKNPDLQAVLVGAKEDKLSQELNSKLAEIIRNLGIPLTELTTSIENCSIDIAYSSIKDEWLISSTKIDRQIRQGVKDGLEILKNIFKKINISDVDEIA